jgi:hypothetical protein
MPNTGPRMVAALVGLLLPLSQGFAQKRAQTLDDVARLLASGAPQQRALDLLKLDCIDFPVDERAIARLKAFGAQDTFLSQLGNICYLGSSVEITSQPAGAVVRVGKDEIGLTPTTWRLMPTQQFAFEVIRGEGATARAVTVAVPSGAMAKVNVAMPRDTAIWPVLRSEQQLIDDLQLRAKYPGIAEDPPEPVAPRGGSTGGRAFIGGILLGGVAFGASTAVCAQSQTAGTTGGYLSNGTYVAPGANVSLGAATGCQAGVAAAGAAAGGLLNMLIGKGRDGGAQRRYQQELANRPRVIADLNRQRSERAAALSQDPALREANAREKAVLDSVRAVNAATVRYNEALPAPKVALSLVDSSKAAEFKQALAALPQALGGTMGTAVAGGPGAPGTAGASVARADEPLTDPVDTRIPKASRLNEKAVAVVIGNRDYKKRDIPGVDYAINDARTMKKYLVDALGFREENVIFEENASFADLQTIFGREGNAQGKLYNYLAADSSSDVFVFYSGHGAPDPSTAKAYLVPVDADPQLIQLTGYPMTTLYENLAKLPAKSLTVMLDACFSGSSDKGMLLKGVSPALLRVETPILSAPNAVLLSASAANQVSAWYEEKKHGMFSYFVFKGLQGDADQNKNGDVAASELAQYVQENVVRLSRRLKGREQTPQFVSNAPDRVLAPAPANPE